MFFVDALVSGALSSDPTPSATTSPTTVSEEVSDPSVEEAGAAVSHGAAASTASPAETTPKASKASNVDTENLQMLPPPPPPPSSSVKLPPPTLVPQLDLLHGSDTFSPTIESVIAKLNDRVPALRTPPTSLRIKTKLTNAQGRPSSSISEVATPSVLTSLARKGSTSPIIPTPVTTATSTISSAMPSAAKMSSHIVLANTSVGLREIAKQIGKTQVKWERPPRSVLLVAKPNDPDLIPLAESLVHLLITKFGMQVNIQDSFLAAANNNTTTTHTSSSSSSSPPPIDPSHPLISTWSTTSSFPHLAQSTDLIVTLGGDGTVLFTAQLFQTLRVPPILPFDLGSLGFLAVHDYINATQTLSRLLSPPETPPTTTTTTTTETHNHNNSTSFTVNMRMRIHCVVNGTHHHVLNDIVIDRGDSSVMALLELWVDDTHLTTLNADGLIISTPTGSTAYSLSAGGSIVHPAVPAMLISPICPHTLSFRPMLLPDSIVLRVAVPADARCAGVCVSFDGRGREVLRRGDEVGAVICVSRYPVPTVALAGESEDWIGSLRRVLGWNERSVRQKPLVGVDASSNP